MAEKKQSLAEFLVKAPLYASIALAEKPRADDRIRMPASIKHYCETCLNLAKIVQGGREDAPTAYRAPPSACSQQTERPETGKTLTRWRCPATTVW